MCSRPPLSDFRRPEDLLEPESEEEDDDDEEEECGIRASACTMKEQKGEEDTPL